MRHALASVSEDSSDVKQQETDMLIYQDYPNVFPLCGEPLKCLLDRRRVRFRIHHEEVLL